MREAKGMKWAEKAWDPTIGCTKISPGCRYCMAAQSVQRWNSVKYTPGFPLELQRDELHTPLLDPIGRTVLVSGLSDLFHSEVPESYIVDVLEVMRETPHHTYFLLTKRVVAMATVLSRYNYWPLPNVNIGASTENQAWFNKRITTFAEIPVHPRALRYLSCEPLLGPINLRGHYDKIGWVICGTERGTYAREAESGWIHDLAQQCWRNGIPFYFHRSEVPQLLQTPQQISLQVWRDDQCRM